MLDLSFPRGSEPPSSKVAIKEALFQLKIGACIPSMAFSLPTSSFPQRVGIRQMRVNATTRPGIVTCFTVLTGSRIIHIEVPTPMFTSGGSRLTGLRLITAQLGIVVLFVRRVSSGTPGTAMSSL